MLIATCNVNGIRAAMRKGMGDWLDARLPDVLLLQEVRAEPEIVTDLLASRYPTVVTESSRLRGRAGVTVALAQGLSPDDVRTGVGTAPDVDSGRWLEVDTGGLTVISAYLHSGTAGTPSMDAKYAHLDAVERRLAQLDHARPTVVAGDFNVVRGPADITNFRPNHNKTSGVFDQEMAYLERWFGQWHDVHRELAGDVQGPYTWWSQRGKAFDNNVGWRIDYQMATAPLAAAARSAAVERAASYDARFSDHAPLVVDYQL